MPEVDRLKMESIKKELFDLKVYYDFKIWAVISVYGIPLVWDLPEDMDIEAFAALSATILGASEYVCTNLQNDTPKKIVVEGEKNFIIATKLTENILFMVVSPGYKGNRERIVRDVDAVTEKLKEIIK